MREKDNEKISNHDAVLNFKTTLIRLGVVERAPRDFKHFLVWFKDMKRFGARYEIDDICSS